MVFLNSSTRLELRYARCVILVRDPRLGSNNRFQLAPNDHVNHVLWRPRASHVVLRSHWLGTEELRRKFAQARCAELEAGGLEGWTQKGHWTGTWAAGGFLHTEGIHAAGYAEWGSWESLFVLPGIAPGIKFWLWICRAVLKDYDVDTG